MRQGMQPLVNHWNGERVSSLNATSDTHKSQRGDELMTATFIRPRLICAIVAAAVATSLAARTANATLPYSYPLPAPSLSEGKSVITPDRAFGKEFSHDLDITSAPPGGGPDPAQVIAWDGQPFPPGSGTADGLDYSFPAPPFSTSGNFQVDALANTHDAFFKSLLRMGDAGGVIFPDRAHLVFSIDDLAHTVLPAGLLPVPIPAGGPILTTGGNVIGGAGEISFEHAGAFHPPSSQGLWAPLPQVNGMPLPRDVDGLEIWGPEPVSVPPGGDASGSGDSDKYSVDTDITALSAAGAPISVWNYDISGGTGSSPYIDRQPRDDIARSAKFSTESHQSRRADGAGRLRPRHPFRPRR
jgi:hypothetical protein